MGLRDDQGRNIPGLLNGEQRRHVIDPHRHVVADVRRGASRLGHAGARVETRLAPERRNRIAVAGALLRLSLSALLVAVRAELWRRPPPSSTIMGKVA